MTAIESSNLANYDRFIEVFQWLLENNPQLLPNYSGFNLEEYCKKSLL